MEEQYDIDIMWSVQMHFYHVLSDLGSELVAYLRESVSEFKEEVWILRIWLRGDLFY